MVKKNLPHNVDTYLGLMSKLASHLLRENFLRSILLLAISSTVAVPLTLKVNATPAIVGTETLESMNMALWVKEIS